MAGLRDEEQAYRQVQAQQAKLYEDLYDDRQPRLLNPSYFGDDATSRRFALLEIE